MLRILVLIAITCFAAGVASGEVPPAKPYADLVGEVVGFLKSDVGNGGIRTNDDDPLGYPVPPYFYHYAIRDGNGLWSNTTGYPGYSAVSYPAYTACVAIDAFLDWRRWSGDPEGLIRARHYADWVLEHRTPSGDLYGNLPYSTQTEGIMGGGWDGLANMADKGPMFGLRLLRLHDITGDPAYLDGALEIAATMVATQIAGGPQDDGRWPFRVVPADGAVTQDYTSHLQPAVRFFDDLFARTGDPLYGQARDRCFSWLLANPCDPASGSFMRWEAFYEDQSPAMQTGLGDHYSAHEMIVELIGRRPAGWQDLAVAIFDSVDARYLVEGPGTIYGDYEPVTLEWVGWPEATYASSLQYARTALLLDQALDGDPRQNPAWRDRALAMAAVCSHGQNDRGIAADGRMFTTVKDLNFLFNIDSWYEQNFNTVKYFLEIMDLEPDLAPANQTHILSADGPLQTVAYPGSGVAVRYEVAGGPGRERIRMPAAPASVTTAGVPLAELAQVPQDLDGWFWDAATGVVSVHHPGGQVEVLERVSGVPDPGEIGGPSGWHLHGVVGTDGTVVIETSLPESGPLSLVVYDLRGRRVRRLTTASWLPAGPHASPWDGLDDAGQRVAAGMYLVRGLWGQSEAVARVLLVR